jgi:hypothetical protein
MNNLPGLLSPPQTELLNAFRHYYQNFTTRIQDVIASQADLTIIAHISDELDEYQSLVCQMKSAVIFFFYQVFNYLYVA